MGVLVVPVATEFLVRELLGGHGLKSEPEIVAARLRRHGGGYGTLELELASEDFPAGRHLAECVIQDQDEHLARRCSFFVGEEV